MVGIFGKVNAGKSTLLNALVGQEVAIVSSEEGTTTDPVRRAYELLDYGKVTFIDTAGFDDSSALGAVRLQKTLKVIDEVVLALFVAAGDELDGDEEKFLQRVDVPTIIVRRGYSVEGLLDEIRSTLLREVKPLAPFFGSHLQGGQCVILVCPIDSEAPAGRLILPQVQAMRAALDIHATAVVVQVEELADALARYDCDLVVTDSQAFSEVSKIVPSNIPLTSFSILLAEQRGDKELYSSGLSALDTLKASDRVLLIEHCSHGVSCDDIGRVKIPALLSRKVSGAIKFDIISGRDPLPEDLSAYSLAVQCGGCMVGSRPIIRRAKQCRRASLPITNYGMLLRKLLANDESK